MAKLDFFGLALKRQVWRMLLVLMVVVVAPMAAEAQSVCVTSRGSCNAGYAPSGAGCYCHIPGFGRKAGNVQGGYGDGYYRPRPRPRYQEDDGYYRPAPRRALGSVCVTSRGECSTGRMVPLGSGCYCMIPNFGRKAGNVRY